jgi:hypothetical protein
MGHQAFCPVFSIKGRLGLLGELSKKENNIRQPLNPNWGNEPGSPAALGDGARSGRFASLPPSYWLLAFITTNLSILSFSSSLGGSCATSCCFSALASNVHQRTSIAAATCVYVHSACSDL